MSIFFKHDLLVERNRRLRELGGSLAKEAGDAVRTHALAGQLYLSRSGWVLLSVPNALVRGAFDALNEPGVELPPNRFGRLNAHLTVMRPEEVERIGGPDKITERGHQFHYTLGPVKVVEPAGWKEMSKVWFIEVHSPELERLRKSYGLSPTPKNGEHEFHCTIAVRRKRVLHDNDVKKGSADGDDAAAAQLPSLLKRTGPATLPADAYVIQGNPHPYDSFDRPGNAHYKAFYDRVKKHLESKGLRVAFDPGAAYTAPPGGKYWVGHSRGSSRLRLAPQSVKTVRLDDYEPEETRVAQEAAYQKLFTQLGVSCIADVPYALRPKPGPEHYTFNDGMRKALDDMVAPPVTKAAPEAAAGHRYVDCNGNVRAGEELAKRSAWAPAGDLGERALRCLPKFASSAIDLTSPMGMAMALGDDAAMLYYATRRAARKRRVAVQRPPALLKPPAPAVPTPSTPGPADALPASPPAEKQAMDDFYANGDHHWYCVKCQEGFDTDEPECPTCGKDCVDSNRRRGPGVLKRRGLAKTSSEERRVKLQAVLDDCDEDLAGIAVYYSDADVGHRGVVVLDVMDWGDEAVGKKLGDKFGRIVGKEHVIRQNEGPVPQEGWTKLVKATTKDAGSKQHGRPVVVVKRRHSREDDWVCPHCNRTIAEKTLYRDRKGWWFHRPCLAKGSIRLPDDPRELFKQSSEVSDVLDVPRLFRSGAAPALPAWFKRAEVTAPASASFNLRDLESCGRRTGGRIIGKGQEYGELASRPFRRAFAPVPEAKARRVDKPMVVVVDSQDRNPSMGLASGLGATVAAGGGLTAGGAAGFGYGARRLAADIRNRDPYAPGALQRIEAFNKAMDPSRAPHDLLTDYVRHGHDLMGGEAFRGGRRGIDVMEKVYKNPLGQGAYQMLTGKAPEWEMANPKPLEGQFGLKAHYGAFASSPLEAQAQLAREIYKANPEALQAAMSSERFDPRFANVLAREQQINSQVDTYLKRKGVTKEQFWNWQDPAYAKQRQFFQGRFDLAKREHTALLEKARTAAAGRAQLSGIPGADARTFYQGVYSAAKRDPGLRAALTKAQVRGPADLLKLDKLTQGKLLQHFNQNSAAGKAMSRQFAESWKGPMSHYRMMGQAMEAPKRMIDATVSRLGRLQQATRPVLRAGGVAAGAGLAAYGLGRLLDHRGQRSYDNARADRIARQVQKNLRQPEVATP